MTKHIRKVAALCIGLVSAGCVINIDGDAVLVRDEKRYTVGPDATLTLETFDGSVKVQSWDRPEVLVEIEKRGPDRETAAAIEIAATQDGNRIAVRAHEPKGTREFVGIGNVQSASVSFNVSVPRSLTFSAQTGDGSINLENLSGAVNLRSGDGSIRGTRLNGDITARTEDGSIFLQGALAGVRAETGDGSVVIEAEDGSAMKSDWDISTGDGSVVFRVPETFDADVDAASRDGNVRGELQGLQHERAENGRESLKGRLGSGGHRVTIRSGDGSIRVVSQ